MNDNIKTVSVKYIKDGKETIKYDCSTGKCWVEKTLKGETTITKEYKKND